MDNKYIEDIDINQQDVRLQLKRIMRKKLLSYAALSREIGVSVESVRKFLIKKQDLRLYTVYAILDYIDRSNAGSD
jgi:hypothetical protein